MTDAMLIGQAEANRRGRRLEYFTIGWNSLEALIALVAGFLAGSVALVSFGFDSVIEVTSGAILLWRLHRGERSEQSALRLVGGCFLVLACYVAYDALSTLISRQPPDHSLPGIVLALVSMLVMPLLAKSKRQVALRLNSTAMQADAKQTELCVYLSCILLGGLLLNALLGWWWADPLAGLVMLPIISKEGLDALRGKACGCGPACHR